MVIGRFFAAIVTQRNEVVAALEEAVACEKCMTLSVLIVEKIHKFPLNLVARSLSIVETATRSIETRKLKYQIPHLSVGYFL